MVRSSDAPMGVMIQPPSLVQSLADMPYIRKWQPVHDALKESETAVKE